jgi:hypothetical protein
MAYHWGELADATCSESGFGGGGRVGSECSFLSESRLGRSVTASRSTCTNS